MGSSYGGGSSSGGSSNRRVAWTGDEDDRAGDGSSSGGLQLPMVSSFLQGVEWNPFDAGDGLLELAMPDVETVHGCVTGSDWWDCFWTAGELPWFKWLKPLKFADETADAATSTRRARTSCHSFVPGTHVLLADGTTTPIEDIRIGDQVLATNPETGETRPQTVTAEITGTGTKHLVTLTLTTPNGNTTTLTSTDEHPYWNPDLEVWVNAEDLSPGDPLTTPNGTPVRITAVHPSSRTATVYNLTIADTHTYYVLAGQTSVLVHNANCVVGTRQFDHSWDQHAYGGAYHQAGRMENVFAEGIDKTRFRRMVDTAIANGTEVPRAKSDPRGGYYIEYDFGNVEVGAMGQNGMRIAVDDSGNFVTAMPKFMY